jgi:outer membrane protein assembly factor BamB
MKHTHSILLIAIFAAGSVRADWLQFRGGEAADTGSLPTVVDPQHAAWRVDLPGRGPSSPIVVRGRVFVTAVSGMRQDRLHVLAFDTGTGRKLWERRFWATGRTGTHASISGAAPTPTSDGQAIYAFYSSNDLLCCDLDGHLRWYRGLGYDYPKAGNDIGMASSPVVAHGVVVVQSECQADSFAAGIDSATGETRWRVDRGHKACWASPLVLPGHGRRKPAVVLQSPDRATAHDLQTGEQFWRLDAECAGIASPTWSGNWLFLPMKGLSALRFSDESTAPEIAWDANRLRPGAPSPVVHDGRLYTVAGAIVKCADAATGKLLWQLRLKGQHWATPVVTGGHLYCIDDQGESRVIKLGGQEGEVVGEGRFGEIIQASPAAAGNALYVRSDRHLWKLE